jgi:YegS/Rv2252/BmrU family lipid kinase
VQQIIKVEISPNKSPVGRALLVVNAKSRKGQQYYDTALNELRKQKVELVASHAITNPRSLKPLVQKAIAQKEIDTIIVGGGDGTVSCLADLLARSHIKLGVIPLGTANDFARNLKLSNNIAEAVATIKEGNILPVDLGYTGDQYFLNVASVGLGVHVANRANSELKKWAGPLAYAIAAFDGIQNMRPFSCTLTLEDRFQDDKPEVVEVKALQVAIANGRFYGGGLVSAPNETITDSKLSVTVIPNMDFPELVRLVPGLFNGSYVNHPKVLHYETTRVKIETRRPHKINMDGEVGRNTPTTFSVAPGALLVYAPRQTIKAG